MTHAQVAKALGISRTLVQAIERQALNKLAILSGHVPKNPKWLRRFSAAPVRGRYRCGRCGEMGHNARACLSAS